MSVIVHVNGSSYLVDDVDQATVESVVLDAVRVGGAFIDLRARDERSVRVLVTMASTVHIEQTAQPVQPTNEEDVFPDFDFYATDL